MVSIGFPNVFFLIARFISPNSADAGSSIFAATEIFAFFRTGSELSAGPLDAAASFLVGTCAVLTRSARPPDLADDGSLDLAAVARFARTIAGGPNDTDFCSIGWVADAL